MANQKKREKRLARLLRPGMELYFVFLLGFCLFTFVARQYILGAIQIVVALLLLAAYVLDRRERKRRMDRFVSLYLRYSMRMVMVPPTLVMLCTLFRAYS